MDGYDLLFEVLNNAISDSIGQYHQCCTEAIAVSTEALELFELESLVNVHEAAQVLQEGESPNSVTDKQKKASRKFLDTIVRVVKAAAGKVVEIGKNIVAKLKQFLQFISKKLKKVVGSKILGGKPWPNGFEIDFTKGNDAIEELCKASQEISYDLIDKMDTFSQYVIDGDQKKTESFLKDPKNHNIVYGEHKHPRDLFNERMKIKFSDKDNAVNEWCHTAYHFEQHGEDFSMSVALQTKMVYQIIKESVIFNTTLRWAEEDTNVSSTNLRNFADIVEKRADQVENGQGLDPRLGKVLHALSSNMISTSEFSIHVVAATTQFGMSKLSQMISKFTELGLIRPVNGTQTA